MTSPSLAAAPHVRSARAGARSALQRGTLVLALLEALAAVVDVGALRGVRAGVAVVVLLTAGALARPLWRLLAGGFAVTGLLLAVRDPGPDTLLEVCVGGLLTVTPVVALLVVVTRLNAVVLAGRYNVALAAHLARRSPGRWSGLLPVVLAYLLAPVLLAGALTQSFGPFQGGGTEQDDRDLLAVCVRALSLGLVWSPLAAPTVFALTLLDVTVTSYVAIALPASLLAFALLLLQLRRRPADRAPHAPHEQDPAAVARLVGFLAALPVLVVVLAGLQGHLSVRVVLLAMLAVTATWTAVDRRRTATRGAEAAPDRAPEAHGGRGGLAPEGVVLYLSLGLFVGGIRLVTSGGLSWATSPGPVVTVAFLGAAACFLVGVHPVAVIAVLSPTVLALDPAYAAVGAFALCAGAQAVNVSSPFSPLSVVGSQMSRSTPWAVSTPVHWRFSLQQLALYGAACAVALALVP